MCNWWFFFLFEEKIMFCFRDIYNPGHNILAVFNNLAYIWITTSKTILHIYDNKLGTRAASRVAEQLKTQDLWKLQNIRKMSNVGGDAAQHPVPLPDTTKRWQ